jgi:antitoxin VapB
MERAKIFMTGRSQAVRIPKAYRFEGEEVEIRREGERVILQPIKPATWPRGFFARVRIRDAAFERPAQGKMPPAPDLG